MWNLDDRERDQQQADRHVIYDMIGEIVSGEWPPDLRSRFNAVLKDCTAWNYGKHPTRPDIVSLIAELRIERARRGGA